MSWNIIFHYALIFGLLLYILVSYLEAEARKGFENKKITAVMLPQDDGKTKYCELENAVPVDKADVVTVHEPTIVVVKKNGDVDVIPFQCKGDKENAN